MKLQGMQKRLNKKYLQVYDVIELNGYLIINIEDPYYLELDLINHEISFSKNVNFERIIFLSEQDQKSITSIGIPPRSVNKFKKFIL